MLSTLCEASRGRQEGHEVLVLVPNRLGADPGYRQVICAVAQGAGLHFQIHLDVAVSGLKRYVAAPSANRVDVDAGAQQMHGWRMKSIS